MHQHNVMLAVYIEQVAGVIHVNARNDRTVSVRKLTCAFIAVETLQQVAPLTGKANQMASLWPLRTAPR